MDRYINADRMIKDTLAMKIIASAIDIDGIVEYIKKNATEDVIPVKHAHWIKRYEEHKTNSGSTYTPLWDCSSCKTSYRPDLTGSIKYCSECGAKMDEKEEK